MTTEPTDAEIVAVMRDGYNCRYNDEQDHIDFARAVLAKWGTPPAVAGEPVAKLWLWKNFVGGKPEYWAFDNPFPCVSVGGDPLTLGEPCGWALFKPSVNGRPQHSEQEVVNTVYRLHATPQPTQAQAGAVPLTAEQITAAAKKLAECMDYPWEHMTHDGRAAMHKHAKAVIEASKGITKGITKGGQHGAE